MDSDFHSWTHRLIDSGGFMGDLVFNGGTRISESRPLTSFLYIRICRKVWYLGWKPTVSHTLSSIFYSLNDIIIGLLSEILPSITLKLGSTAFGTGVRICIIFFRARYAEVYIKDGHINVSSLTIARYGICFKSCDYFNCQLQVGFDIVTGGLTSATQVTLVISVESSFNPHLDITNRPPAPKPSSMLLLRIPPFSFVLHNPATDR